MQKKYYDICVTTFSDLRFDGRSKNLILMLNSLGYKVLVYSIGNKNQAININGIENKIINIPWNKRMLFRWKTFLSSIKNDIVKYNIKIFWAADLYSLPICRYIKSNTIYDSREIYSQLSTLNNSAFRQFVLSFIEKKLITKVNIVVTSGKLDSKYLQQKYNLNIPIYEIYNYPTMKEYVPSNIIREQFNISNNQKILLYQGVLLPGRGIVPVMRALVNIDNFVLVILGDGKYKNELIQITKELNIENKVFFAGNINYDELHKWTSSADIGLCNIEPISFSYELALPNKLFEYLLAELPVIITDLPALREIVEQNNCGKIISKNNTTEEILNAITEIINETETLKKNIRQIKYNYTYEKQSAIIKQIWFCSIIS